MSHLTAPANTKIAAGAPGLTGTSPGEEIGTAKVQDQSNTRQEPKHPHDHDDKSIKPTSSETQGKLRSEETKPKIGSKDSLDVVTEPPVRASTPTPSGAPGATGASPNQPFGGGELQDGSPKVHDHSKHLDHVERENAHSSARDISSLSKSSTDRITSSDDISGSKPLASSRPDADLGPGVTARTKTPAGAVGPTGTAPMEAIGDNELRDSSQRTNVHHELGSHTSSGAASSRKEDGESSTTPNEVSRLPSKSVCSVSKKSEFDGPNASFSSEIGGKEDPGRVAEEKMFERNAQHGDVGSMGVKQDSITGGGQFEVLKSEEAA